VVGAPGKIPRGIAPLPSNLAFDFAQRIFQLCCDALQKRGARVRGRPVVANFAAREDDFELLKVTRFVGRLRLMSPFGFLRRHFPLAVGMQSADHRAIEFLEPFGRARRRGRLGGMPVPGP